jgi:hypothetical protein
MVQRRGAGLSTHIELLTARISVTLTINSQRLAIDLPSMRRRVSREECSTLCSDVLVEAQKEAGTWSLMTHRRVSDILPGMGRQDLEIFLGRVCARLVASDATMGERFKLAQLCTMLYQKVLPGSSIDKIYADYKEMFLKVADNYRNEPLGQALGKLLTSLYSGSSADRSGSRSARSLACPLAMKPSRRVACSRTPCK